MKKTNLIIVFLALCMISVSASAQTKKQFSKPIQPAYSPNASNDATYNIGITGGGTFTNWIHFGGSKTTFNHPIPQNLGIIGGLTFEKVLNKHSSIGLEALFAMRSVQLSHTLVDFLLPSTNQTTSRRSFRRTTMRLPSRFHIPTTSTTRQAPPLGHTSSPHHASVYRFRVPCAGKSSICRTTRCSVRNKIPSP